MKDVYKIGNQSWQCFSSTETTFSNGEAIPLVTSNKDWLEYFNEGKPCCKIISEQEVDIVFYNFFAVNDCRGIGTNHFMVPTLKDHDLLINCLGGWEQSNRSEILNEKLYFFNELNGNIDGMGNHIAKGLYGCWWLKINNSESGFYGDHLPHNMSLCFAINNKKLVESHWRRPTYKNFGYQLRLIKSA
jgi:hypothetical protein